MTAVGELVLLLSLLVSARCELRARDPDVEEEEEEQELGGSLSGGGGAFPPHLERFHPGVTETPLLGERRNYPARSGNWCAFVQRRVVTMAVECGTEKYTIKSQSPCPSGTPDCHLVMYKLSTRPIYRQKQQIVTALLWRCCPGNGGHNCEDTVSDAQAVSRSSPQVGTSEAAGTQLHTTGLQEQQSIDTYLEQNDHEGHSQHNTTSETRHSHNPHHETHHTDHGTRHADYKTHHGHQETHQTLEDHRHHPHQDHLLPAEEDAADLLYPDALVTLPVPHIVQLVMFQLQPVFDGFNQSLEHLSRQVEKLDRDVAQLKSRQLEAELQVMPSGSPELEDVEEERLDARVAEVLEQVRTLQQQMENQRREVDKSLHSQHAILQYNLTSFKANVDMKLKRHQMMQVSLQAVNTTMAELKLDQDQPDNAEADPPLLPASDAVPRWEAIKHLDNMVVNNTIRVGSLMEDAEVISGNIQQLRRDFRDLQNQINQTARTSQVQFMETVLEVEAAREVVLRRVSELAGNLSHQGERLQELDVDVDDVYNAIYRQNTSSDCNCKDLRAAMARLERGVTNVTELANENRLALEEVGEGGEGQWGGLNNWEPAAEALQHGLQQVKEALASEKTWTQTLDHSLAQLSDSVKVGLAEVSTLKEVDRKLMGDLERLSEFFNLLLKDAVRHDDVLEVLLGEEVPEFLKWPVQDQEAHSIPALKEQLGLLQEQLKGGREEVLSADQPSTSSELLPDDWLSGSKRSSSYGVSAREQKLALHPAGRHPDHRGDGGDLWNLEKRVEELGLKVLLLEKKYSNTSASSKAPPSGVEAQLQAEVTWLKRGLEEHLRMFKNVFSNADVLARADATLELDKLWQLVKNKDGKKKRGGDGREGGGRGNQRSRRDTSSGLPVLSQDSVLLVASSPLRVSDGIVTLASSDSDVFTAPVEGVYLFVLTLDLRPGPAHVVLKRGSSTAAVSLHRLEVMEAGPVTGLGLLLLKQGEEVRLELKGGVWAESEDNVIAVLLMSL